MDQRGKIEQYVLLGKNAKGRAAADLIQKATSEPGLFAFGELTQIQGIKELQTTEWAQALQLLQLFCYGSWSDYKGMENRVPLNSQQQLKLKQLTIVSMAGISKRLGYESLMSHLEISNVRELEDFLISSCFYTSLVSGKLDQKQACLHVTQSVARDVKPEELLNLVKGLENWLQSTRNVSQLLTHGAKSVQDSAQAAKDQKAENDKAVEAARKKFGKGGGLHDGELEESELHDDFMDVDMKHDQPPGLPMRSKRRR